jgi:hypothetical protein
MVAENLGSYGYDIYNSLFGIAALKKCWPRSYEVQPRNCRGFVCGNCKHIAA